MLVRISLILAVIMFVFPVSTPFEESYVLTSPSSGFEIVESYRAPITFGEPVVWLIELSDRRGNLQYVSYRTPPIYVEERSYAYEGNVSLTVTEFELASEHPYADVELPLMLERVGDAHVLSEHRFERNETHIIFFIEELEHGPIRILTSFDPLTSENRYVISTSQGPIIVTSADRIIRSARIEGDAVIVSYSTNLPSNITIQTPYERSAHHDAYASTGRKLIRGTEGVSSSTFFVPIGTHELRYALGPSDVKIERTQNGTLVEHETAGRLYIADGPIANVTMNVTRAFGSLIANSNAYEHRGHLVVVVERDDGGWTHLETLINDTMLRTIPEGGLDLEPLVSWNTTTQPAGDYRFRAWLERPEREILTNTDSSQVLGNASFTLTGPDLELTIDEIRVYDVTDTTPGNRKAFSNELVHSGTATTFTVEKDRIYRFEVDIDNTGNTTWSIEDATVNYTNFVAGWSVETGSGIWFSNETDLFDRRSDTSREGGSFDGTVTWNTTDYTTGLAISETASFFVIINTSSTATRTITFTSDTLAPITDSSTLQVIELDTDPPVLYELNESLYNVTPIEIFRGESFTAYARWNKSISAANITYQTTAPGVTVTVQNTSAQQAQNWTNFTIATFSTWYLGEHNVTITAADLSGNLNDTLPSRQVYVFGRSRISSSSVNTSTLGIGDTVRISCRVVDSTNGNAAIAGYSVSFTNGTGTIGTNTTGGTGWAYYDYVDSSPGTESVGCFIEDDFPDYYKTGTPNASTFSIFTAEFEPPVFVSIDGPATAYKGDVVSLNVRWSDNFALDRAVLSTNASGSFVNVSSLALFGVDDWANFSYTIPTSMTPGVLGWRQFANDTSGNVNVTSPVQSVVVTGYSRISSIGVVPGSVSLGNPVTVSCTVQDEDSSVGIEDYSVSFSWKNDSDPSYTSLGSNSTLSSGIASYTWTPGAEGLYDVRCTISDDASLYYEAGSPSVRVESLNVVDGADTQPPRLTSEATYTVLPSVLFRGSCFDVTGEWDENLSDSYVRYNDTGVGFTQVDLSAPFTANWTNESICTNSTWSLGDYSVKLFARDLAGNLNNTLDFKPLEVRGRSVVS
jgi:hypothetical protein